MLLDSCEIALDSLRLPLLRFWQWSLRSGGWCRSEASSHRHGLTKRRLRSSGVPICTSRRCAAISRRWAGNWRSLRAFRTVPSRSATSLTWKRMLPDRPSTAARYLIIRLAIDCGDHGIQLDSYAGSSAKSAGLRPSRAFPETDRVSSFVTQTHPSANDDLHDCRIRE